MAPYIIYRVDQIYLLKEERIQFVSLQLCTESKEEVFESD